MKTVFFHSEFGMSAGRFNRSRRDSHTMKDGTRRTLRTRKKMFRGLPMLEMAPVSAL